MDGAPLEQPQLSSTDGNQHTQPTPHTWLQDQRLAGKVPPKKRTRWTRRLRLGFLMCKTHKDIKIETWHHNVQTNGSEMWIYFIPHERCARHVFQQRKVARWNRFVSSRPLRFYQHRAMKPLRWAATNKNPTMCSSRTYPIPPIATFQMKPFDKRLKAEKTRRIENKNIDQQHQQQFQSLSSPAAGKREGGIGLHETQDRRKNVKRHFGKGKTTTLDKDKCPTIVKKRLTGRNESTNQKAVSAWWSANIHA